MVLSMPLLAAAKFPKSDEWFIVHNETSVIWAFEQALMK